MTLPATYFDGLYAESPDPWGFVDRWYEERKRALTLALLPDARYGSVFEPGCSIGVLTAELAGRCDRLLATDVSKAAVREARQRCADLPQVEVRQADLLGDWPDDRFDLVVLSEVLYYLSEPDAGRVADLAMASAQTVLAVHWRHPVHDYPLGGDAVNALLDSWATKHELTRIAWHLEDDVVAAVWSRDPRSAAARDGLL